MVILTMTENGNEIMKRSFSEPGEAFAWIAKSRYGWEQVSPTECVSAKRTDCKLFIGGDY